MGSDDESHFNISLIVRDKVTKQCPQTTTFEEKGEPKQIRTEVPLLTARPNRFTMKVCPHTILTYADIYVHRRRPRRHASTAVCTSGVSRPSAPTSAARAARAPATTSPTRTCRWRQRTPTSTTRRRPSGTRPGYPGTTRPSSRKRRKWLVLVDVVLIFFVCSFRLLICLFVCPPPLSLFWGVGAGGGGGRAGG